jgi:hypothetical protein
VYRTHRLVPWRLTLAGCSIAGHRDRRPQSQPSQCGHGIRVDRPVVVRRTRSCTQRWAFASLVFDSLYNRNCDTLSVRVSLILL